MDLKKLIPRVESAITRATGTLARVEDTQQVSGGCINESRLIQLNDGRTFFLKANFGAPPDMFRKEAEGLTALACTHSISVPNVICCAEGSNGFLILEAVRFLAKAARFF